MHELNVTNKKTSPGNINICEFDL